MKKYLGLRNAIVSKSKWMYLLFYELDADKDASVAYQLKEMYDRIPTSYVIYETKAGYHAVGLTPFDAGCWGNYFQALSNRFNEFYAGHTIRLSLKDQEIQRYFAHSFVYPYVEKLARKYCERFGIWTSPACQTNSINEYAFEVEQYGTVKD